MSVVNGWPCLSLIATAVSVGNCAKKKSIISRFFFGLPRACAAASLKRSSPAWPRLHASCPQPDKKCAYCGLCLGVGLGLGTCVCVYFSNRVSSHRFALVDLYEGPVAEVIVKKSDRTLSETGQVEDSVFCESLHAHMHTCTHAHTHIYVRTNVWTDVC